MFDVQDMLHDGERRQAIECPCGSPCTQEIWTQRDKFWKQRGVLQEFQRNMDSYQKSTVGAMD